MTDAPQQNERPLEITVNIPPEAEVGVHSDLAQVWQINETFVLDFLTMVAPPQEAHNNNTNRDVTLLPTRLASRIRLDPTQVPGLITALQEQLEGYQANRNRMTLNQRLEDLVKMPPRGDGKG